MALARIVKAQFHDPANDRDCGVAFEYDDATLLLTNIYWANQTTQPMYVKLTRVSNGQFVDDVVPPQTPVRRKSVSGLGIIGVTAQGSHGSTYLDFGVNIETQYPADPVAHPAG